MCIRDSSLSVILLHKCFHNVLSGNCNLEHRLWKSATTCRNQGTNCREPTECFTCLSSNIDSSGLSSPEIPRRISLASSTMARLSTVWRQAKLSLNTKLRLYNALILSVLLQGCETWVLLKADKQKLEVFHVSYQCQILGLRWYHLGSNASVTNLSLIHI